MENSEKLRQQYDLPRVPDREAIYNWESADKYEVIQFAKSSESRKEILKLLLQQPMTTNELAKQVGLSRDTVWYHIDCLRKGEKKHSDEPKDKTYPSLVESKTPNKRTYHLWGLTEKGYYTAKWLVRDE